MWQETNMVCVHYWEDSLCFTSFSIRQPKKSTTKTLFRNSIKINPSISIINENQIKSNQHLILDGEFLIQIFTSNKKHYPKLSDPIKIIRYYILLPASMNEWTNERSYNMNEHVFNGLVCLAIIPYINQELFNLLLSSPQNDTQFERPQ